jgi:hypothetical protein
MRLVLESPDSVTIQRANQAGKEGTMANGRGGKRQGAGRPRMVSDKGHQVSGVDDFRREAIGARCEELWQAACEASLQDLLDREPTADLYRALRKKTREERARWGKSQEGRDFRDDLHATMVADLQNDVNRNRAFGVSQQLKVDLKQEEGLLDGSSVARLISYTAARPKGMRPAIVKQVAQEVSEEVGYLVTARFVETCWKEFRALQRVISDAGV